MDENLKEWLGIKPADFMVYGSWVALGAMYFLTSFWFDVLLAIVALALTAWACAVGMPSDPRLSSNINRIKKISYPLFVLITAAFIVINFTVWNQT